MEHTRTDLLNHLAVKYNLNSYLEIGVQVPELNFDKIICKSKIGVDPDPKARATFCKTSDDFFEFILDYQHLDRIQLVTKAPVYEVSIVPGGNAPAFSWLDSLFAQTKFDLIFIDGLHTAEQVRKDFNNALKVLSPNGFIVIHDCNPIKEEHTIVPRPTPRGIWNGDVYKFASTLGVNDGYCTVDIDNGCGVFRNGIEEYEPFYPPPIFWNYFNENRKELLNLISLDEFVSIGT